MGLMFLHEFEQSEEILLSVRERAADADLEARDTAELLLASQYVILGQLNLAAPMFQRAAEISANVTDGVYQGLWTLMRAAERNWRADYDQAELLTEELLDPTELSRRKVPIGEACGVLWMRGLALAGHGQYNAALRLLHESLSMSERLGEALYRARTLNSIGWVMNELQAFDRAIDLNQRSVEAALDIKAPDPEIECNAWLNLADAHVALGDYEKAEE
jgi:tetratricopeptide (TPR) repeat protein